MKRIKSSTIKVSLFLGLLLFVTVAVGGCAGTEVGNPEASDTGPGMGPNSSDYTPPDPTPTPTPTPIPEVDTFNSSVELERYLKDQYAKSVDVTVARSDVVMSPSDVGVADAADSSSAYSDTNVQEQGVDESDLVKTDGRHLYIAGEQAVHIVDITDTGGMRWLASQPVDGCISALYLRNNVLVVLYVPSGFDGRPWNDMVMPTDSARFGLPYWVPVKSRHAIAIFDISDPGQPVKRKEVQFEGRITSSRRIEGRLYLVQQFLPVLPPIEIRYDGSQGQRDTIVQANQQLMADMPLSDLIPHCRVMTGDGAVESPTVAANNMYYPLFEDSGGTITSVVTFDLDDPTFPFISVGMVADAHIIYASTRALYIVSQRYRYAADCAEQSTIYKYDLTCNNVTCTGGGHVPGWILNQFSLGEYQDVLRVATTTGHAGGWSLSQSVNHVYCLELEGKALNIVGRLENLAAGEQIRSARFMGERGYLVTFEQIDPLFTLDLADPYAPVVAGQLKVSGYSSYIHPYGDDHLITIGMDVKQDEDGSIREEGVQLSILDISDFSDPVRLSNMVIGDRGTSSEALHNHKAFTFWAEYNLLAIPVNLFEHPTKPAYPWSFGEQTFKGIYIYRVSTQSDHGFEFLGRIATQEADIINDDGSPWVRGVFVDQNVYAVNGEAVRSASIDNIEATIESIFYP